MAREYTDEERAAILANYRANGGNLKKTARESGVPAPTLRHWLKGVESGVEGGSTPKTIISERVPVLVGPASDRLAEACDRIAQKATGAVELPDLPVTNWRDAVSAMTVAGIAIEKSRLLRERATSITGKELNDDERDRRLAALVRLLHARETGQDDPARIGGTGLPSAANADLDTAAGTTDNGL